MFSLPHQLVKQGLMQADSYLDVIAAFANLIGVAFGLLLVYGLRQKWHWVVDPPQWMFLIYFPAVVKIVWGPKYVLRVAYITAYGSLILSLIGFIQTLIRLIPLP
jgi:hypothetical protein